MLLGITEFTKAYLQVKDNPWPYVNLTKLVQKARMGDGEVVELLRIANRYLPRVRLEYGRINEEMKSTKAELNSWKAAVSNEVLSRLLRPKSRIRLVIKYFIILLKLRLHHLTEIFDTKDL
jgi:predicted transcriptional regulator